MGSVHSLRVVDVEPLSARGQHSAATLSLPEVQRSACRGAIHSEAALQIQPITEDADWRGVADFSRDLVGTCQKLVRDPRKCLSCRGAEGPLQAQAVAADQTATDVNVRSAAGRSFSCLARDSTHARHLNECIVISSMHVISGMPSAVVLQSIKSLWLVLCRAMPAPRYLSFDLHLTLKPPIPPFRLRRNAAG